MSLETEEARVDTYCQPNFFTLKSRKQFQFLRQNGKRSLYGIGVQITSHEFLYAISISRKECCAVKRNRIKRRIRSALRIVSLPKAMFIFRPTKAILDFSWLEVQQYVINACADYHNHLE